MKACKKYKHLTNSKDNNKELKLQSINIITTFTPKLEKIISDEVDSLSEVELFIENMKGRTI